MRVSARMKESVMEFFDPEFAKKNIFSDILNSVGDCTVSSDGKFLFVRHFMEVKVWDMTMPKVPLRTIKLFEPLKSRFCDIYTSYDTSYSNIDRFSISLSGDGSSFVTGMFDSRFHIV